jgi:hypothetical protein
LSAASVRAASPAFEQYELPPLNIRSIYQYISGLQKGGQYGEQYTAYLAKGKMAPSWAQHFRMNQRGKGVFPVLRDLF